MDSVPILDTVSIGLFPVPNNCKDCTNTYVNCKAHWNVTFKIILEVGRDSHNTYKVLQSHEREFFAPSNFTFHPDEMYSAPFTDSGTGFYSNLKINETSEEINSNQGLLSKIRNDITNLKYNTSSLTTAVARLDRSTTVNASSSGVGTSTSVNVTRQQGGGNKPRPRQ